MKYHLNNCQFRKTLIHILMLVLCVVFLSSNSSLAGGNNAAVRKATEKVKEINKEAVKEQQESEKDNETQQSERKKNNKNKQEDSKKPKKDVLGFDVYEYRVIGNTKLSEKEIGKAVYNFMGEKKTIEDVEKARESLEQAYHDAGYLTVFVSIPEQDVDNKIVMLNVTEGKVSKLRVSGSRYYSLGRIKSIASSVEEGEVPHFPTLQKQLTKLNRTADKRVTPVVKPGPVYGTFDVDLKVEDDLPLHGNIDINDQFFRDTSRLRLGGSVRYDNLFQRDHSVSLTVEATPERPSEFYTIAGNYLMRFDTSDALLSIYGAYSKMDINSLGGTNILNDIKVLGVNLIKPLPSLGNYYHYLSAGFEYKDFDEVILSGGTIEFPISYMPVSAGYSGTLERETSSTELELDFVAGIQGLFSDEEEFANRREGIFNASGEPVDPASPNFFVTKVNLEHTQDLPKGFQLFGKVGGQYSDDMLIIWEQHFAGGIGSVRGYLQGDAPGDRAVYSSLELRTPSLFKNISWIDQFKLHTFYDWTRLSTVDPIEGEDPSKILAGVGFGGYLKAWKHFHAKLELAWPLKDHLTTEAGDYRTHMSVGYDF